MVSQAKSSTATRTRKIGVYAALLSALSACAPLRPWVDTQAFKDKIKTPEINVANQTASQLTLPIERLPSDTFWVRPQASQGVLPDRQVNALSVTERGLFDVLQIIFDNTNVPLSFEGGADAASRYGVVTLNNLSGSLPEVMNKLGEIMGFFWTVSDTGVLRIMPEQQFVVTMPPVINEDSMAGITNTMQYLGARDVYLDRINRSLVFRANRRALQDIQAYLDRARATRSLIVYDMNVLQVDLNDSANMGVRWEQYKQGTGLNTAQDSSLGGASSVADRITQLSRTGTGIETLIFGENFSANFLIDFLKTQGDVKTLSQPKIGLMNGSNGNIRVGQSTTFVSRVGSQIVNGVAQSTADTQNLRTGLEVSLTGETHDATIYTRINISITELLALKKFTALGVDLNLPEVADRELKTQVRCRPGDTILLGGITVSRAQNDFINGLGTRSKSESAKQTELVITIRPRLLMFDDVASAERMRQEKPEQLQAPTQGQKPATILEPVASVAGPTPKASLPLRLSTQLAAPAEPVQMISKLVGAP
ncbi:type II secretion system protein GspD [Limnobacter sp.]|uniref:type II secretion system protein GspD n=1 Tax=Limnobacter sp. TaxID=2003368 RepID=UPI0035129851